MTGDFVVNLNSAAEAESTRSRSQLRGAEAATAESWINNSRCLAKGMPVRDGTVDSEPAMLASDRLTLENPTECLRLNCPRDKKGRTGRCGPERLDKQNRYSFWPSALKPRVPIGKAAFEPVKVAPAFKVPGKELPLVTWCT